MKPFDALLVLGLKLKADGSPEDELKGRIDVAADCFHKHLAPLVICCGGQTPGTPLPESQIMQNLLVERGVPKEAVVQENKSQVTYENLRNARLVFDEQAGDRKTARPRVLIVSSDYHILRARYMAHAYGFSSKGKGYRLPDRTYARHCRSLEVCYFTNFLMGWETGKRKQPKWYNRAVNFVKTHL